MTLFLDKFKLKHIVQEYIKSNYWDNAQKKKREFNITRSAFNASFTIKIISCKKDI